MNESLPNNPADDQNRLAGEVLKKITDRAATVGVIGLGYVGLPLAVTTAEQGFAVIGFDIDEAKVARLHRGESYIGAVGDGALAAVTARDSTDWTTDFSRLGACDVIIICVPTPLTRHREPDLSFVTDTLHVVVRHLRPGTLVVLESTTYPGTTDEVVAPILAEGGLRPDRDFWVAFSPEREDPGNARYRTATIPKVVGGDSAQAIALVRAFYERVVEAVVPVSSARTAEAVKITENLFRAVNIALVNELKTIYDAMDIDIWEVIDAAATKPFGFMPFYPGPGLGGHCIPIDPFYLTWKARESGIATRFIELAGEINTAMPGYVLQRLRETLDRVHGIGLSRARILLIGIAYKKNVADMRESPSVELMDRMRAAGAEVDFLDPLVAEIPRMREYPHLEGRQSIVPADLSTRDDHAILIATDHDEIDYAELVATGIPIVDTRNAISRRKLPLDHVTKA